MTVNLRLLMHLLPVSSKHSRWRTALMGILCRASPPHSIDRRSWRGEWLLATALTIAAAVLPRPALAIGGAGGQGDNGVSGGTGSPGNFAATPGGAGISGGSGGGGGGGGGRGLDNAAAGGTGGSGSGGAAGHSYIGSDGSAGGNGTGNSGGGGGGGGAPDAYDYVVGTSVSGSLTGFDGGRGGNGGNSAGSIGGGGGGGEGGFGYSLVNYPAGSNSGTITGGKGGDGGTGGAGGNGGSGGAAVYLGGYPNSAITFTNSGTVTGGNGGLGGAGLYGSAFNGHVGAGGAGIVVYGAGNTIINSGAISGGLSGDGVRADAITFLTGANTLTLGSGWSLTGGLQIQSGSVTFAQSINADVGNTIYGAGSLIVNGAGAILTLSGTNSYSGGTTITAGGGLAVTNSSAIGSGALTFNGGLLQAGANGVNLGNGAGINIAGGAIDANGFSMTYSGVIGNGNGTTGGLRILDSAGGGRVILTGANTYSGGTIVFGTLQLSGMGTLGAATGTTNVSGGTLDLGGTTQTQAAVNLAGGTVQNGNLNAAIMSSGGALNGIGGTASLTTTGGTTIITGTNTNTGGTTVSGGVLDVQGTLSDPTVNSGGTLTGSGSVGGASVNAGGTFAPGNGVPGSIMTVNGSLALQSGAIYLVQLNPATASYANVTGAATLGGATVNAVFASGSYISKTYTILTAAGGISSTFASLVNTNLPTNFHTTLSYDADNAYLNLVLNFAVPNGLNRNQQAVGNALTNSFNANGSIPLTYGALTAAGLTQASGELGTSSQQTTFTAMGLFMGVLSDPFGQRSGGNELAGGAAGFVDEGSSSAYAAKKRTDAFAMVTKAPPQTLAQRWSVWTAGFGGSQSTDGNVALGSSDTTSRVFGTAVGADYRFSAETQVGFALGGGGTNFSVANLGSGRSDLFQAGAYLRHFNGPAYLSAALAYGWQDITTDRMVTIAGVDRLRAEFNANAYSGRLEGGYRLVVPWIGGIGITPYGAAQVTTFDLPAYAEQVVSGSSAFALSYAGKSVTDTRSELGLRGDKSFAVPDGVLTLRGRFAWAHDFNPDRAIAATFQALPGASFVVNGAAQAHDSALTTASLEMTWLNGWSAAATFEGEFSNVTQSYAGKGVVRYAW